MRYHLLAVSLLTLFLSGCVEAGKQYVSKVNSFADLGYSGGRTYFILSGLKNATPNDLEFKEYSAYVESSLNKVGYQKVQSPAEADVAIFLAYGISNPKSIPFTYTSPDFGYIPGSTTSYNLNTSGPRGDYTTTGTARTPGTFGVTGYSTYSGVHTVYTRTLVLDAYDFAEYKKSNAMKPIWKTTVVSTGSSGNLRDIIPFMTQAAEDYIGTSTTATIAISEKGEKKLVKD